MRIILIFSALMLAAGCGGNRASSYGGATGEISRACLAADRSAANARLCSCVQSVANSELSSADRNRVARFFADPEFAHEIKISDTNANDAFWRRYQAFVRTARNRCG